MDFFAPVVATDGVFETGVFETGPLETAGADFAWSVDAVVFDFCFETVAVEGPVDFFLYAVFFDDVLLLVVLLAVEESVAPKSEISATLNARRARKQSV